MVAKVIFKLDTSRATAPTSVIIKKVLKILLRVYCVRSLGVWLDEDPGELLGPPPGKGIGGGRGKLSDAPDSLSAEEIRECRAAAPEPNRCQVPDCDALIRAGHRRCKLHTNLGREID